MIRHSGHNWKRNRFPNHRNQQRKMSWLSRALRRNSNLVFTLLIIAALFIAEKYKGHHIFTRATERGTTSNSTAKSGAVYTCAGKQYCNQMSSCEEATFYIENCGVTTMDGDGDGVPCERGVCGW